MSWRVIVVGGHTRSIGKTQLVCDLIAAFPEANWTAGKITQYGHGFCVKKGKHCDCAPTEHVCALTWEDGSNPRTDSGRFLATGAQRSFWLRTKQGFLGEGIPLLREELRKLENGGDGEARNLILESNTFLDFVKPSLYLMVLDSSKTDFKESARLQMQNASAFVLRRPLHAAAESDKAKSGWPEISSMLGKKPRFLQSEGEPLPGELRDRVQSVFAESSGAGL